MVVGGSGGSVMYAAGGGVVYAAPQTPIPEGATPVLLNLPHALQVAHEQSMLLPFVFHCLFCGVHWFLNLPHNTYTCRGV